MNFWIHSQAFSKSKSSAFRLRGSIQRHPAFFQRFFEIWIVYHLGFHQIYRRVEKLFKFLNQRKIVAGVLHGGHRLELHEKVKVPNVGQCGFSGGGAENMEVLHSKGFAKRCDLPTQIENFLNHDEELYKNRRFQRTESDPLGRSNFVEERDGSPYVMTVMSRFSPCAIL